MEKEFIPYEQALTLKELGFNEPCFGVYTKENDLFIHFDSTVDMQKDFKSQEGCEDGGSMCLAPLYQQAFGWLNKQHKYAIGIYPTFWGEFDVRSGSFEAIIYNMNDISLSGDLEEQGYKILFIDEKEGVSKLFKTYKEAQLECLKHIIEKIK